MGQAVCRGKQLLPDTVNAWMKDALRKHRGQEQEDDQEEDDPAPGSASAEPSNDDPALGYASVEEFVRWRSSTLL